MQRLTSWIVPLVLLMAVLTGCSGASEGSGASESAPPPSSPSPSTAQESASPAESPPDAEESGEQAWPRTIKDAVGNEIVLAKKPERIAVLHPVYLDYFFALGEPPFASANAAEALQEYGTLQPYAATADILDLGSGRELGLEFIAQAKPDLIVTFKGHIDTLYDSLVKIAPVVQIDFADSWQNTTMLCAAMIGKEREAERYISETNELIKQTQDKLGDRMNRTFAMLRIDGKANFFAPGTSNTMYYKADSFGLKAPEGYPEGSETLSLEGLSQMNPDYIIIQHDIATAKASVKEKESLKVWNSLKAVQEGHVLFFDNSLNTASVLAVRLAAQNLMELEN